MKKWNLRLRMAICLGLLTLLTLGSGAVALLGMVGIVELGFQAVEAMSRWAQGVSLMKRWMNRAAVIEPP